MASALQLARQQKKQKIDLRQAELDARQAEIQQNEKEISRLKRIVPRVLKEFDGVKGIKYKRSKDQFNPAKSIWTLHSDYGRLLIKVHVGYATHSYSYSDDYPERTETKPAICWVADGREGDTDNEEHFVEAVARLTADYV